MVVRRMQIGFIYEKRLFNGGTYKLSKKLIDSNDSIINQSAIEIVREKDR